MKPSKQAQCGRVIPGEGVRIVEQVLRSHPDLFVQNPDGAWILRQAAADQDDGEDAA
jgi:hypothetical protein